MSNHTSGGSGGRVRRRALFGAAAGSLVAAGLLPFAVDPARAATLVTPNPIPARIGFGSLRLALEDFCTAPATKTPGRPRAMLNYLYHAGDGSRPPVCCRQPRASCGRSTTAASRHCSSTSRQVRHSSIVLETDTKYLGLRTLRLPSGFRTSRPARPSTAVHGQHRNRRKCPARRASPGRSNVAGEYHHDVIAEWQVAADRIERRSGTRREVLRIRQWNRGHNTDQLLFNPNLDARHGRLRAACTSASATARTTRPTPTPTIRRRTRSGRWARSCASTLSSAAPAATPCQRATRSSAAGLAARDLGPRAAPSRVPVLRHRRQDVWSSALSASTRSRRSISVSGAPTMAGRSAKGPSPPTASTRTSSTPCRPTTRRSASPIRLPSTTTTKAGRSAADSSTAARRSRRSIGHYLFGDIVNGRVFAVPVASLRQGSLATINQVTLLKGGNTVTLRGLLGTVRPRRPALRPGPGGRDVPDDQAGRDDPEAARGVAHDAPAVVRLCHARRARCRRPGPSRRRGAGAAE